jgi:hypothetical protein
MERQKPAKQFARESDWRGRSEPRLEGNPAPEARAQEWRKSESPAKRVIDGAVPGRRWQSEAREAPRGGESAPEWRQRAPERSAPAKQFEPREYRPAPAPREYRAEPREYKAPREYRPEPRPQPQEYRAPAPRAPLYSAPAPSRNDSRPAPNVNTGSKGQGKGRKG